ncbi:MAG: hypothetical protein B7W98_02185, partial [Parcubacteria group bacterium 20-58-5]
MKRFFDVLGASVLLALAFPVCCIIALAVRLTTSGPIFFSQKRVGRGGAEFRILKFCTMYPGSHLPERIVLPGDERVTPIGRFLRSTHLDELPQLLNVLCGHMSLVGPRPLPLDYIADAQYSP